MLNFPPALKLSGSKRPLASGPSLLIMVRGMIPNLRYQSGQSVIGQKRTCEYWLPQHSRQFCRICFKGLGRQSADAEPLSFVVGLVARRARGSLCELSPSSPGRSRRGCSRARTGGLFDVFISLTSHREPSIFRRLVKASGTAHVKA